MNLEDVQRRISAGESIEDVARDFDWKGFEIFCSGIISENGWYTRRNYRFRSGRRYEIDILARKGNRMLLADCKHWGERPGKAPQLRISAERQLERAMEWEKINFLESARKEVETIPLVITWLEEDITREHGVWIVPVFKLNTFLLEIDNYVG